MRFDLRYLTLLSYREVLSPRSLLRRTRAWCSYCLQEWAANDGENSNNKGDGVSNVYEPLLWALEALKICPHHDTNLQTNCPHANCKQSMAVLAPRASPGYCSKCERWLGFDGEVKSSEAYQNDKSRENEHRVWQEVGELLQAMPSWAKPMPRNTIQHKLTYYLDAIAEGNPAFLAQRIGISKRSVRSMLDGAQVPQINTLLSICDRLETTPLHFLSRSFDKRRLAMASDGATPIKRRKHRQSPRPFDRQKLEFTLQQVLSSEEYPPPNMRAIGRRLGYDPSHLHKHFPRLCTSISAKYKIYLQTRSEERRASLRTEVRQVTHALQSRGHHPTFRLTRANLGKPRDMFEPDAINAWHEALLELGLETQ